VLIEGILLALGLVAHNGHRFDALALQTQDQVYVICVGNIYRYDEGTDSWLSIKSPAATGCPAELTSSFPADVADSLH